MVHWNTQILENRNYLMLNDACFYMLKTWSSVKVKPCCSPDSPGLNLKVPH